MPNDTELVVFSQDDPRWGIKVYSNHNDHRQTMANSGLAPTLCASIVAALRDDTVDPWILAQLSMEWGTRTYCSGTSYSFFGKVAMHYDFSRFVNSGDIRKLKECLKTGGYAICNVRRTSPENHWRGLGDYILVHSYHDGRIYAYGFLGRRRSQSANRFVSELKRCFCYYPG